MTAAAIACILLANACTGSHAGGGTAESSPPASASPVSATPGGSIASPVALVASPSPEIAGSSSPQIAASSPPPSDPSAVDALDPESPPEVLEPQAATTANATNATRAYGER